jgi:hypothetical protein
MIDMHVFADRRVLPGDLPRSTAARTASIPGSGLVVWSVFMLSSMTNSSAPNIEDRMPVP